MTRHHSLTATGIRKLVSEASAMNTTDAVLSSTITRIEKLVSGRFEKGKKLDSPRLRNLAKSCDDIFHEHIRPIRVWSRHVEPTRAHPKADAYEACYVGVKRQTAKIKDYRDLYQLFSFRIYANRKLVVVSLESLPYAFEYHAAERLMERAENVETAFWQIASDVAEWSPLIRGAEYFATRVNRNDFSIPIMGKTGMLIGGYTPRISSPSDRSLIINATGVHIVSRVREECSQKQMFVGETFISRFLMRPNQAYAMKLMTDWRETHEENYAEVIPELLWQQRMLAPRVALSDETKRGLATILDDAILRRALHPDPEVNRIVESDWMLPLGDWAHDRYRKSASVFAPEAKVA